VRFPLTWDSSLCQNAEVATVAAFAASRLGVDPVPGLPVPDWLILTGQSALEVIAGPVFTDQTAELAPVRAAPRWYPREVERYVLAGGWQRLCQQMPMVGRTAGRGDELGSKLLSAQLAEDLRWPAIALACRWPPYAKRRAMAFRALPVAAHLAGPLTAAAVAPDWRDRENGLADAGEALLSALLGVQRARGLPAPARAVSSFWDRHCRTVDQAVPEALLADITDPNVTRLPPGSGRSSSGPTTLTSLPTPRAGVPCDPPTRRGPASAKRTRRNRAHRPDKHDRAPQPRRSS
jgi:hypothetical protein